MRDRGESGDDLWRRRQRLLLLLDGDSGSGGHVVRKRTQREYV